MAKDQAAEMAEKLLIVSRHIAAGLRADAAKAAAAKAAGKDKR